MSRFWSTLVPEDGETRGRVFHWTWRSCRCRFSSLGHGLLPWEPLSRSLSSLVSGIVSMEASSRPPLLLALLGNPPGAGTLAALGAAWALPAAAGLEIGCWRAWRCGGALQGAAAPTSTC